MTFHFWVNYPFKCECRIFFLTKRSIMTVVVYATNPNQTDLPAHPGNETYNNLTGVEK